MASAGRTLGHSLPRLLFLLLSILWLASGCSATMAISGLNSDAPRLQKRVIYYPLINLANVSEEASSRIDAEFMDILLKAPNMRFYKTPQDMVLPPKLKSPEFGIITYPELVKKAAELEMNALVTGALNPIELTTKKAGIWPFRETAYEFEVSMVINVVDVASGCLYLSNLESEAVVIPSDETEGLDEKQLREKALERAIPRILDRQAFVVTNRLLREPWSGKIVSAAQGNIIINGGDEIGVRQGQLFTVYASGEPILCRNGNVDVLGKRVGEIKITSVGEDRSDAVAVNGGPFTDGQVIRFVR